MKHGFVVVLILLALAVPQLVWSLELKVHINGLDETLTKHVQNYLDIYRAQDNPELSLARLQRHHNKAEEQIRTALQVYGYYKPVIHSELIQEQEKWIANYNIKPGDPVTIDRLDVQVLGEGKDDPELRDLLNDFPLRIGQAVEHPAYDQARNLLLRVAIEQGYLDANMSRRELLIDLPHDHASVVLHLETGKRYYFGPVNTRQEVMNDDFIARYIHFKEGDVYSPGKLLRLQRDLSDSGYYQSVEVRPQRDAAVADHVPIEINLTPRKPRQWSFGLGYATDTGARGTINHTRIINKDGHKFEGRVLVSEKKDNFILAYTIPLQDPVTDQLGFSVRYVDEITDSRDSQIAGTTLSHTTNWGEWQRVISLNYERETYIVGDEPEETKRILFPALSVTKVVADNRLNTRHGYRIYSEIRGANENLLSDTNYGQLRLGLKWIRGIGEDTRLLLRGDFGTTNVAYLDKLPASQRFFAGGDNSVRGYAYEELGPKNDLGEVIGGKQLVVGSVELERRIAGNWSGAVFYDVGNAINSFGDDLYAGAGFGVRWHSPVGPIRFDFAWALDKEQDKFRLHVVIGPDL